MKSQRRHELKTNALARKMEGIPEFWREYSNKILLGLILVMLVIFLLRYRSQQAEEARIDASTNLSVAERAIQDLWYQPLMLVGDQPGMAKTRDELAREAESALDAAMRTAEDPQLRADVYVARGNLNWLLANFPALPAAATQPSMQLPKSSSDYLSAAASAFSEVLNDPLSSNHAALTAARLGLAAVAENKVDWASADRYYNEVFKDSQTDATMKDYAEHRLKMLDDLKKPVLLAGEEHENAQSPLNLGPPVLGPAAPTTTASPQTDFTPFNLTPSQPPLVNPSSAPTTLPAAGH
jgi:predicted negative regulator of RcsB-dependent stress response